MCKGKTAIAEDQRRTAFRQSAITGGFGFGDFGEAIA